ncbi:Hypothetical protein PHPALM_3787 [Phytophthora palmivora]|uniref:Uncharacterized protein n=1 Tax=Phytophthora palmivora TaxID=4796 RepID=A0A2P4YLG7_9STRA|nr:Hypothetical protein PHPALM_3787 [Phytophthora palmivora]
MPELTPRLALHPQRKRKFFADLAQLLDEDLPTIRPLVGAFFGPELPEGWPQSPSPDFNNATQTLIVPSHSLTSDSFESVEFGASRSRSSGISSFGASQQSSHNESMADSLLFLPVNNSNSQKGREQHTRFEFELETKRSGTASASNSGGNHTQFQVTTLVNNEMISEKSLVSVRLELVDYYDTDRMCWMSSSQGVNG